jgi:hypothetical protein
MTGVISYLYASKHTINMAAIFDMDGIGNDYGFYEDLDVDDDGIAVSVPRPSNDERGAFASFPTPSFYCRGQTVSDPAEDREERDGPLPLARPPPIPTRRIVEAVIEEGGLLPRSMRHSRCDRLYSSSRDGASFGTFLRRVRGRNGTLVVATTAGGRVVGGYAADAWSGRGREGSRIAAATGNADDGDRDDGGAFLFVADPPSPSSDGSEPASTPPPAAEAHAFIPGLDERRRDHGMMKKTKKKPRVEIFKPSRRSSLRQACRIGSECISMSDGEGGGLSLVIENSFSSGASHIGDDRGEFAIVEFEVYGFAEE